MPSFDLPSPLSKKRKITTTYGSRSYVTRALRAVRHAVPANLISSGNDEEDYSIRPSELEHDVNTVSTPTISGVNAESTSQNPLGGPKSTCDTDRENNDNGRARHGDQDSGRRISKRLQHNAESPVQTPSRKKRRKNGGSAGFDGLDELEPLKEPDRSSSTRSLSGMKNTQQSDPLPNLGQGDDLLNPATNPHGNGERSSGRSRRPPKRFSPKIEDKPSTWSTPPKKSVAESPPSTISRKRGRPRKQSNITPAPHNVESELGFRKIPRKDVSSTRSPDISQRGSKKVSNQNLFNGKGSSPTLGHHLPDLGDTDRRADVESMVETTYQPLSVQPLGTQVKKSGDVLQGRGFYSDDYIEIYKDPELPQTLQRSISKLQRLLKISPAEPINLFKSDLLQGLVSGCPLVYMDEEYRKVHQLVTQTVLAGEGNSMLVVGPRGSGKTALVETVLSDLAKEHYDDFIVVRLNGFIHTDDKLALREIWRQLGREGTAEEGGDVVMTNYADTLTSLLALLAHSGEDEGQEDQIARSVIFVIDEFDLFATHPRQTLLYNLFDVAQSRNAPIAVLGLTTRIDIVESLEKRVKSRFGQRYVYLTYPRTFSAFQDICRSALMSREPMPKALLDRVERQKSEALKLKSGWNEYVDALFTHDKQFASYLRYLFARSKCVSSFLSASLLPVSLLSGSSIPTGGSFIRNSLLPSDSKLQLLSSLADLELSLLIAGARLDVILDTDVCSFSMVYEEYVQLASRVKVQSSAAGQTAVGGGARVWGKEVALGSWEKLMELGLVVPVGMDMGGDGSGGMCRVDVALEEIGPSCPGMESTMSKWCREI
ncbi:MAG: hypothetical protein LQ343_003079 [Gyalolechia ehrenbergii]|nr:MAG: hypothetical protein LQ343_003079 [Gyalolechia ehrenbergii]